MSTTEDSAAGLSVAIVGATGAVGEALLEILESRAFPIAKLQAFASSRSVDEIVSCGRRRAEVQDVAKADFGGVDLAFFSAGSAVSLEHVPRATAAGAMVIDNSSAFRREADVPLVVVEVNPDDLAHAPRRIIANPNCSTMQLMVALAPLHRAATIERMTVATYQAVSGAGHRAMEELGRQTAAMLGFQSFEPKVLPVQIAFNLIPHIDAFDPNGYTGEEMKIVHESRRILHAPDLAISATAVRVPIFYGHSCAVHLEFAKSLDVDTARRLLAEAPGVEVVDDQEPGGYPTPVTHAAGNDPVYVGRLRKDLSHPRGLALWVVADNIRKGAALNAVQLAEVLLAPGGALADR